MRLFWISIICLLVGLANARLCPNGKFCKRGGCCIRLGLSGPEYECCSVGCLFRGDCYIVPQRPKLDRDSILDEEVLSNRNNYVPSSGSEGMESVEAVYDSPEESQWEEGMVERSTRTCMALLVPLERFDWIRIGNLLYENPNL